MIGCFAMTELAHGSNVAGLETTATFDEESDEFIIHTPHLGATKWWIGGAASTATHAAVFAQMIIKGKKCGVKTFVTQLRDIKWVYRAIDGACSLTDVQDVRPSAGYHNRRYRQENGSGWYRYVLLNLVND